MTEGLLTQTDRPERIEKVRALRLAGRVTTTIRLAGQVEALRIHSPLGQLKIIVKELHQTTVILTLVTIGPLLADREVGQRRLPSRTDLRIITDRVDLRTIAHRVTLPREAVVLADHPLQEAVVHHDQDQDLEDKL